MKPSDIAKVRPGWIVGCRNDHRPYMPRRVTAVSRTHGTPQVICRILIAGINRFAWMDASVFRVFSKSKSLTQYRADRRKAKE